MARRLLPTVIVAIAFGALAFLALGHAGASTDLGGSPSAACAPQVQGTSQQNGAQSGAQANTPAPQVTGNQPSFLGAPAPGARPSAQPIADCETQVVPLAPAGGIVLAILVGGVLFAWQAVRERRLTA